MVIGHAFIKERRFGQRLEAVARHQLAHLAVDRRLVGLQQGQHLRGHRLLHLPGQLADLHQHVRIVAMGHTPDAVQDHEQLLAAHPKLAAHAHMAAQPALEVTVSQHIGGGDAFQQPQMLARIRDDTAHRFDHRNVQVLQETLGSHLGKGVSRHRTCLVSIACPHDPVYPKHARTALDTRTATADRRQAPRLHKTTERGTQTTHRDDAGHGVPRTRQVPPCCMSLLHGLLNHPAHEC